jgi:large subunit ribosomal protein L25
VLSQETREVNIEALPGDIPDSISHDVSGLEMNHTLLLSAIAVPKGVTFLDDPEETVLASVTQPTRVEEPEPEVEEGEEGEEAAEAEGEAPEAEAEAPAEGESEE